MKRILSVIAAVLILSSVSLAAGLPRYEIGDVGTNESQAAVIVGNRVSITGTGSKIISFMSGKATGEVAYIDKAGNLSINGTMSLPTVSATTGAFTTLNATTANINTLNATTETVTTAGIGTLNNTVGNIATLNATTAAIATGNITTANITNEVVTGTATIAAASITSAGIGNLNVTGNGTIETATINKGTANLSYADISGGQINGTAIGTTSAAAGTFTTARAGTFEGTGGGKIDGTLTLENSNTTGTATMASAYVSGTVIATSIEGVTASGIDIEANRIIRSDVQLTGSTADGFAATPTAIYNMDATSADAPDAAYTGTKVGAYDLTVKAGSLASGADALGNSKYCQFQGSGYLQCTDPVYDFSGAFGFGAKFLLPDWTPATAVTLISNADAANAGCRLVVGTDGALVWYENAGSYSIGNVADLDITKFHDFAVKRDATYTSVYVNGRKIAYFPIGTITAKAKFQIGGYNGANQLPLVGTRVDEIWVDLVNTHTDDTIKNVYARSAKKFAIKAQDTTVMTQPPVLASGSYVPTFTNGTNVAASTSGQAHWVRVGNMVFVSGSCGIDPTAADTQSVLGISLPIFSNLTAASDLAGQINGDGVARTGGVIYANITTDVAECDFSSASTANRSFGYTFAYVVK